MLRWNRIPVLRRVEPFVVAILLAIVVAALLPAGGRVATGFSWGTTIGVGVLFFLYGARMAPAEAVAGLRNWRLQGSVAVTTYLVFPLLGILLFVALGSFLDSGLLAGVLFLTALPSTVQSCVVFTSIAGGNVPGAVVSATVSNLAGIALTPLLATLLLASSGAAPGSGPDAAAVGRIVLQLLVPFLVGLLAGRWIGRWVRAHKKRLQLLDRGVIVAVVYAAFSRGVRQGVWGSVDPWQIVVVFGCVVLLLAVVLALTWWVPRTWRAPYPDRATILFCGSNKSLATGLPMATVLFPPHVVGLIVLPIILYHPLQITVCSMLAARLARRGAVPAPTS